MITKDMDIEDFIAHEYMILKTAAMISVWIGFWMWVCYGVYIVAGG